MVITGLTRKRLGFVTRYSAKASVFSQKLRFPAVFAALACRKQTDHLSVFYQSSHQNYIRRGIEEVITGLTRNQFGSNPTWVRIPSSPPDLSGKCPEMGTFHFLLRGITRRALVSRHSGRFNTKAGKHRVSRGNLGTVLQMGIDVCGRRKVAVAEPFLNLLHGNSAGEHQ